VPEPRDPNAWIAPQHDPFDSPDREDEADTRERVLEGGEDAGDGDAPRVRRELLGDDAEEEAEPEQRG
jgi:hypothetical protein